MKAILYSILGMVTMLALVFGLNYFGLVNFRFFALKYENSKREVFENTQSYVEGKRQDLIKYYNEWRKADESGKEVIRIIVLQDFANFDTELFTSKQSELYNEIIG